MRLNLLSQSILKSCLINCCISYLCFLLIVDAENCSKNIVIRANSSGAPALYQDYNSSANCSQAFNAFRRDEFELCPHGLLHVNVTPVARHSNGIFVPHVELDISVIAHDAVSWLFLHLECIYASDQEDTYCHDAERMVVDGVWRWPCRAVHLQKNVAFPFRFGYSCFRIFDNSQYWINVTALPHNCRQSFIVTIPSERQLFPSIDEFHAKAEKSHEGKRKGWTPSIVIDFSDEDGLWFRVQGTSPEIYNASIQLLLFSFVNVEDKAESSLVETFRLQMPNSTGVKWRNAPAGNYSIYAHVLSPNCPILCAADGETCKDCPHTMLNFTLASDRSSIPWKALRSVEYNILFLIVLVIGFAITAVLLVGAIPRMKRYFESPPPPTLIPLVGKEKKKVMLVYCDDCEEHSDVVSKFSQILSHVSEVEVLLDQQEFVSLDNRPHLRLPQMMRDAHRVLVIISPCSERVLEGKEMFQRRPFPDLFRRACADIISECNRGKREKYAIIHLPYSGATPYQFDNKMHLFNVPDQLQNLTMFLHGHSDHGGPVAFDWDIDEHLVAFRAAIQEMQKVIATRGRGFEERFVTETIQEEIHPIIPERVDVDEAQLLMDQRLEPEDEENEEDEGIASRTNNTDDVEYGLLPESDSENE